MENNTYSDFRFMDEEGHTSAGQYDDIRYSDCEICSNEFPIEEITWDEANCCYACPYCKNKKHLTTLTTNEIS